MAVMTIRGLDDDVRDKLRIRAAQHGRSMEAEVRSILSEAVESPVERTLLDALLGMREALGGLELEIPPRTDQARDPFA
ncbi:MAG: Arc family DNA-binding protein [Actinobacteria bacterium]|nr:Arc family DNA-binding protein [Actinomycetota bacterium]